jgi:hypothetical protein
VSDEEALRSTRASPLRSFARASKTRPWLFKLNVLMAVLVSGPTGYCLLVWIWALVGKDPLPDVAVPLGVGLAIWAGLVWGLKGATRTDAAVDIFEDRITVREKVGGPAIAVVLWCQIRSFDDAEVDRVVLHASGGRAIVLVPTSSEEDRVALIELLDARGVRRGES